MRSTFSLGLARLLQEMVRKGQSLESRDWLTGLSLAGRPDGADLTQMQFHFPGTFLSFCQSGQILSHVKGAPAHELLALTGRIKTPASRPWGLGPVKEIPH